MNSVTTTGIWTVLIIFSLIIGKLLLQKLRNIFILRALPSPPGVPILGVAIGFMNKTQEGLFQLIRGYSKQYRPIYRLSLFLIDFVILVNADDVEQILSNHVHLTKSKSYEVLQPWLGTGLLTSTGEKWQFRRKVLTPAFHFKILQDFLGTFNEKTVNLVDKIKENLDDSGNNIVDLIDNFALETISDTAMGMDSVDEDMQIEYRQNIRKIGKIVVQRLTNIWYENDFIFNWTSLASEEKKVVQSLHKVSETVIKKRKAMRLGDGTKERKRLALLDLLLKYRDEGATIEDEGIREEVDTFLFEGHDTTSIAICMCLLLLANNKHIQEQVTTEIESVIGTKPRPVTQDDLNNLKYLECCIKETLRLYPSVPSIERIASKDFTTSTGYKIPKGTLITVQIYDLHRDEKVFPNPEKFDPDRFLPENVSGRHSFAYVPFSAGPRNCIGQKFAIWEIKTVLCGILQSFRLDPVDKPEDIKFCMDLILRTNSPIRVKFNKK